MRSRSEQRLQSRADRHATIAGSDTRSALAASDFVVIVVDIAAHSLRGLTAALDMIDDVCAELNPDLDVAGVLANRVTRCRATRSALR